ncbi:putative serine protease PepD [Cryobacterium mesophilum]|nr:trypsin-like peptidase domain-containing protein [Terrimesophilobacter mesophilus]MBB5633883.1 putative serine protease PepD [Terrimesophilobacter mesophilus]
MTDNPEVENPDTTEPTPSAGPAEPAATQPTPSVTDTEPTAVPPAFAASAQAPASAPAKRSTPVGLVAALAVGALVGGVSGAGVATWAITSNVNLHSTAASAPGPSTITVNDAADATRITAIAASAGPSVVTVSVQGGSSAGTGSGVILTEDGYILTNTHVVTLDGETAHPTISVQSYDGHLYTAKLVGTDPITDLAVIKIQGTFQPLQFADSSKLNVGDDTVAIGAPLGLSNTVTNGIVSALNRSITVSSSAAPKEGTSPTPNDNGGSGPFNFWEFPGQGGSQDQQPQSAAQQANIFLPVIQTDAAINPGNSGGALLDLDGKVIGINVAIAGTGNSTGGQSGSIGVGFAIPSNLAKRIAFDIINGGAATHGLLGATVMDVTGDSAITTKTVVGASVQSVTDGGAAAKAGIRKGDVITGFNGLPITGSTDLTAQVRAAEAGSHATVTYVRNGQSTTVNVVLGELK